MKAAEINQYEGPEELNYEEAAVPVFEAHDVLVRVFASGVNPVDWKVRQASIKRITTLPRYRVGIFREWSKKMVLQVVD